MSGLARCSQRETWPSRWRIELTFQVPIFTPGYSATEKEVPQPQEEAAFGLRTAKWLPIRLSV